VLPLARIVHSQTCYSSKVWATGGPKLLPSPISAAAPQTCADRRSGFGNIGSVGIFEDGQNKIPPTVATMISGTTMIETGATVEPDKGR
jgi:hypothetical protein